MDPEDNHMEINPYQVITPPDNSYLMPLEELLPKIYTDQEVRQMLRKQHEQVDALTKTILDMRSALNRLQQQVGVASIHPIVTIEENTLTHEEKTFIIDTSSMRCRCVGGGIKNFKITKKYNRVRSSLTLTGVPDTCNPIILLISGSYGACTVINRIGSNVRLYREREFQFK